MPGVSFQPWMGEKHVPFIFTVYSLDLITQISLRIVSLLKREKGADGKKIKSLPAFVPVIPLLTTIRLQTGYNSQTSVEV